MFNYKKTYTLPFKFEIPSYTEKFLENGFSIHSRIKYIKRCLYMRLKGQNSLEISKISSSHKKILWINFSAPSLGDSLMDLSSRILLSNKEVDLLTHKKNVSIYDNDLCFSSVYSEIQEVINESYDLVIIDSYSTRSIKIKARVSALTPFVGIYGYFNGPEVNRVLFSFHQMNKLLGYPYFESEINHMAKCSMKISTYDKKIIESLDLPGFFIAIAIGGEWEYRKYKNWPKVIEKLLLTDSKLHIILLGSNNAIETEREILNQFKTPNLTSYVSKISFNQTAQIIRHADLLFCCDGGLMHAANALNVKIIALFAKLNPEMQLTSACKSFSLFDPTNVNNISVKEIIQKYDESVNADHNRLPT